MNGDEGANQNPGQKPEPTVIHNDLAPDQAVSLQAPSYAYNQIDDAQEQPQSGSEELAWTASEFIAHPKNKGWYVILGAVTLLIALLAYFINRDFITVFVILMAGGLFGVAASRQPRQLQYGVSGHGIAIGSKTYSYAEFRSFAIAQEGAFSSINFMPLKRFAPMMSIYYSPDHEESIMEILSKHLPISVHEHTLVERLMQRIHF